MQRRRRWVQPGLSREWRSSQNPSPWTASRSASKSLSTDRGVRYGLLAVEDDAQVGRRGARHLRRRAHADRKFHRLLFKTFWNVTNHNQLFARPVGPDHLTVPEALAAL